MQKQSFKEEKLTITTIIINSANFLLTAKYLVQNLGLKVKHMNVDKSGIRKLYLHAATDDHVKALEICLTSDHVAAQQYPVLLGVIAENNDDFLSSLERENGTITLNQSGMQEGIIRWKKSKGYEYFRPEVPLCLLSPSELNSDSIIRCYTVEAVLDWLLIPEKAIYEDGILKGDSWVHWITIESRSLQLSIDYYDSLGFRVMNVSDDWDEETHHVGTDTTIGIFLRNSQKSIDDSHVAFSVVGKNENGFLSAVFNKEYSFARIDQSQSENEGYVFTDINSCTWKINTSS